VAVLTTTGNPTSNSELAILVPVSGRPQNVRPLLRSIHRHTPKPHSVYFITDVNDGEERATIKAVVREEGFNPDRYLELFSIQGGYAKKINEGVRATAEPLVFMGADDLHFHEGWLEAALSRMDSWVGVVGTNDMCNARTMHSRVGHSTHSLMARWYAQKGTIDEPDKVLHEGYWHEFVDDEFIATARRRGAYAHAIDSYVEHLHPHCGKVDEEIVKADPHYGLIAQRMRLGRALYWQRQRFWTT
jgi:hypothetical protein